MKRFLALLLFIQQSGPSSTPRPADQTGSIEGVVYRVDTNQPLAGAQIALTKVASAGAVPSPPPPPGTPALPGLSAIADDAGKFTLSNVPAGSYRVLAACSGFVPQEFGARQPGRTGAGTVVNVVGSETVRNIVVRLTPNGSVSGRITDVTGAPLMGLDVMLLRASYDSNGSRTFQITSTAQTDDRGQYRLYWLPAGQYYVSAAPPLRTASLARVAGGRSQKQVTTFYPGVTDADIGVTVEVKPGIDLSGIDFPLLRMPAYRIRGHITGLGGALLNVSVNPRQPMPSTIIAPPQATPVNADGSFELNDVTPGQYWIRAQTGTPTLPLLVNQAPASDSPTAAAAVDVLSDDLENLVIALATPKSVTGHITVEGLPPRGDVRLSVGFSSISYRDFFTPSYAPVPVSADGTFAQANVATGEYQWSVRGLPPNYYIREARFGGVDVIGGRLAIPGLPSDSLSFELSTKAGQLEGLVRQETREPLGRAAVALIPDTRRERRYLFRPTSTDATGRFTLSNIAPGDYKLFAWEDIEGSGYFNADILRPFETKGIPVHISESSRQSVEITAVRSGAQQ